MHKNDSKKEGTKSNKEERKMMNVVLKTNSSDLREKLLLLQQRANKRRKNPNLRHMPNNHDIKIANDNFKDLEYEVYSNIDKKDL